MKSQFSQLDGLLCLAITAHLRRTPEALRMTARRVAKRMAKKDRDICAIMQVSRDPHRVLDITLKELNYDATQSPRID